MSQADDGAIHHILITGQSLSQGVAGSPPLSTHQPYGNVMLRTAGNSFAPGPALFFPEFVPLVESERETMGSALANSITARTPQGYRSAVTRHGFGSQAYANLKEGSIYFETGMEQVAKARIAAGSVPYGVTALAVVHGEQDTALGTGPAYSSFLFEWQRSYVNGVRRIVPGNSSFPLITDQVSTMPNLLLRSPIPVLSAQLAAAEDNPANIILVGPKYHLIYASDKLHLNNTSYRRWGEYYGKVYRKVVINHQPWRPLSPARIERQGQVITVTFNVPAPPLRWDLTTVVPRQNYGFEYRDSSSNPPAIQSVTLAGPRTVRVTLNRAPAVGGGHLRYAFSGRPGHAGGDDSQGIGGNLADSDSTPSIVPNSSANLANWCVSFNKMVLSGLDPVVLLAPLNGAIVLTGMAVRLAADVFDTNGLQRIDFYEATKLIGSVSAAPYERRWTPGRGPHRVRAVAVYASRSMMSAEAAFTVNDLPRVSLTRPMAQTVQPINRAITLQATASDDGHISRVDFWYSREQRHWHASVLVPGMATSTSDHGPQPKPETINSMRRLSTIRDSPVFPC